MCEGKKLKKNKTKKNKYLDEKIKIPETEDGYDNFCRISVLFVVRLIFYLHCQVERLCKGFVLVSQPRTEKMVFEFLLFSFAVSDV